MSFEPFFHESSGSVRFWVPDGDKGIGASIASEVLSYCFRGREDRDAPLKTYLAHRDQIHAVVLKRAAEGAWEPVMVKRHELGVFGN